MNFNIAEKSRMHRLPPYVFAEVNALKMEKRWAGEDIIDLGMGNPDLPAPKHIIEKLVEAARKKHNHRYSASRGITRLREAVAEWYKRKYDIDLDPEQRSSGHHRRKGRAFSSGAGADQPGGCGLCAQPHLSDPSLFGDHRRRRCPIRSDRTRTAISWKILKLP